MVSLKCEKMPLQLTLPPRTATTTATAKPRLPKADILTSLPPSLVDVSPSPPLSSAPSWDLRQGPLRHGDRETAEEASELSPGGGSKFNESWPSVSEQEGVASGVEVGTDAGGRKERDAGKSKEEEEEEGNANTSKEDSTLARYGANFILISVENHAPPSAGTLRDFVVPLPPAETTAVCLASPSGGWKGPRELGNSLPPPHHQPAAARGR